MDEAPASYKSKYYKYYKYLKINILRHARRIDWIIGTVLAIL